MRGLPPGPDSGRFAQAAAFHRDPLGFLRGTRAEFGDAFTLRLAISGPMVVFADPAVIGEIAEIPREVGHAGAARRRIVQMISERSVLGADREEHRVARERLEPAFEADVFDARRDEMTRIAESHLADWPTRRPFRVLARMRRIVDEIFVRVALGVRDEERARALAAATYRMLWTPGNPPASPPGRYAGLVGAAGKALFDRRKEPAARLLAAEIEERRRERDGRPDVIAAMLRATPAKQTSELVDELLPLLMAGQEPPAAGLTWILDRLARHPELAEHFVSSAPDDPLRTAAIREALRLRPAVHSVARRLSEPRVIGGYELPAGMTASVPIVLLHRDPVAFPEPNEFRPERFLERDLDGLPYLPFGDGPRICLGALARARGDWDRYPGDPPSVRAEAGAPRAGAHGRARHGPRPSPERVGGRAPAVTRRTGSCHSASARQRQGTPQDEHRRTCREAGDQGGRMPEQDVRHEHEGADHRQRDRGEARDRQPVGYGNEVVLVAESEEHAVVGGRRDQQHGGGAGEGQRHEVLEPLQHAQIREPRRKRRHQQKSEQDLNTGLNDTDLLKQLDEIAVTALQMRLVAAR